MTTIVESMVFIIFQCLVECHWPSMIQESIHSIHHVYQTNRVWSMTLFQFYKNDFFSVQSKIMEQESDLVEAVIQPHRRWQFLVILSNPIELISLWSTWQIVEMHHFKPLDICLLKWKTTNLNWSSPRKWYLSSPMSILWDWLNFQLCDCNIMLRE